MTKTLRSILALVCLMTSLPLLAWGFWPPRRETRILSLHTADFGLNLSEPRTIRLEFSPLMRAGDSQVVQLTLQPVAGAPADPLYETYTVIAEAKLDLPFADVRPADVISTPLAAAGSATFYWEVRAPSEVQNVSGTAWLFLRFIPKAGGEETRQAVSAQPVQISPTFMLKRTGAQARVIGVVGAVVGLALALPFFAAVWRGRYMRDFAQRNI